MKIPALLVVLTLSLAGCTKSGVRTDDSGPATPSLAGTQWRLVEIQSMDDAQGTTRPDDPDKYILSFGADGRVAVGLDCNRGSGPWKSAAAGSLEIGPLATTRAMCPPPSLGDRLAADLDHVRSYIWQGQKLSMALMADGGILVWEPVPKSR